MKFSIIVVTFNRKKAFVSCLESIKAQSIKVPHEVIVILNGDLTYIEKYRARFREFSFSHIPFTTAANARNIALKKAKGEYILFLGEDSVLSKNYFENINFDLGWDVLGGPEQSPQGASSFQKLIGRALSSPLCMGPAFKRHSKKANYDFKATEESLTISNLWFKRSLFNEEGFQFNRNLFKNEEYYLLDDMSVKGKIFHHNPKLCVYHQRPPNMEKLGAALIQSGKCRAHTFLSRPKKKNLIYFAPLLFLVFFLLMIFQPNIFFLNTILLYALAILTYDIIHHRRFSPQLVLLHYLIQLCYSVGLIKGTWSGIREIYNNFKENKSLISESRSK
jgi:glycosyltransferase involved in cell wall biosynthesis